MGTLKLTPVKRGQIWRMKTHAKFQLLVTGKKKDMFKCVVLTDKPGVYAGTHTMSAYILNRRYELVSK